MSDKREKETIIFVTDREACGHVRPVIDSGRVAESICNRRIDLKCGCSGTPAANQVYANETWLNGPEPICEDGLRMPEGIPATWHPSRPPCEIHVSSKVDERRPRLAPGSEVR